jgi:hypothetical protein
MSGPERVPAAVPVRWSNQREELAPGRDATAIRATTTALVAHRVSSRTGRRGLAAVRASLSARDWDVLRVVEQHRYLATKQIEVFAFHDHATALTGARVCRRVLRRLAALRVLTALERRIGGVRAGSASYVWHVGPVGARLLREHADRPRRRQREPGSLFLHHCLAVADAHLALIQAHRARQLELLDVHTEPQCWRRFMGLGGARLVLQPDLYVVTTDPADQDFVNCWFIEIDRGTEHPARLLRKCERYEAYRATGAAQSDGDSFPLVVWVMSTPQSVERLATAIAQDRRLDHRLYRVITVDQLSMLIRSGVT